MLVTREINIQCKLKPQEDNATHPLKRRKFKIPTIPNVCWDMEQPELSCITDTNAKYSHFGYKEMTASHVL